MAFWLFSMACWKACYLTCSFRTLSYCFIDRYCSLHTSMLILLSLSNTNAWGRSANTLFRQSLAVDSSFSSSVIDFSFSSISLLACFHSLTLLTKRCSSLEFFSFARLSYFLSFFEASRSYSAFISGSIKTSWSVAARRSCAAALCSAIRNSTLYLIQINYF